MILPVSVYNNKKCRLLVKMLGTWPCGNRIRSCSNLRWCRVECVVDVVFHSLWLAAEYVKGWVI